MRRRRECEAHGCERRRPKPEMVRLTLFSDEYVPGSGSWVTYWVCREHVQLSSILGPWY